jgi:hypothetical protein
MSRITRVRSLLLHLPILPSSFAFQPLCHFEQFQLTRVSVLLVLNNEIKSYLPPSLCDTLFLLPGY